MAKKESNLASVLSLKRNLFYRMAICMEQPGKKEMKQPVPLCW